MSGLSSPSIGSGQDDRSQVAAKVREHFSTVVGQGAKDGSRDAGLRGEISPSPVTVWSCTAGGAAVTGLTYPQ